ncbi:MAG: HAD-IIA family hydrolase [Clostridia bacterium]
MRLSEIDCLMIDVDGTIFRGDLLLPGANNFFKFLDERKIEYLIVTNNTKSAETYQERFALQGIKLMREKFFTCTDSTKAYIMKNRAQINSVYIIGKRDLIAAVAETGVEIRKDATGYVDAVIVGGDFDLSFEKLKNAVLHLQKGSMLIGSNGDMLIPTEMGLVPEAGMTLAALTAAVPIQPIMLGKPEKFFFELAASLVENSVKHIAMLGDRLDTDIAGANAVGFTSILICTGVDNQASVESKNIHPDYLVEDLMELMKIWDDEN